MNENNRTKNKKLNISNPLEDQHTHTYPIAQGSYYGCGCSRLHRTCSIYPREQGWCTGNCCGRSTENLIRKTVQLAFFKLKPYTPERDPIRASNNYRLAGSRANHNIGTELPIKRKHWQVFAGKVWCLTYTIDLFVCLMVYNRSSPLHGLVVQVTVYMFDIYYTYTKLGNLLASNWTPSVLAALGLESTFFYVGESRQVSMETGNWPKMSANNGAR